MPTKHTFAVMLLCAAAANTSAMTLDAAIAGSHRDPANVAGDV
jgi:hypothetical protein